MDEISIPAQTGCLDILMDFIFAVMRNARAEQSRWGNVAVAAEEIFVNIASYAYASDKGDVIIRAGVEAGQIVLEFRDSGKPFNPLNVKDPDISLAAEDRAIGGLGIYIVKKLMDEVRYEYRDGQNALIVSKKITGPVTGVKDCCHED